MSLWIEQLLLITSTPVFAFVIGLEWVLTAWHHRKAYTVGDTATNVYLAGLNGIVELVVRGFVLWLLGWFYLHRAFQLVPQGFVYWLGVFVMEDFVYYLEHCVDHHCRMFWAVHVTHHSSLYFNISTGFRSSVFQPIYRGFYFSPVAWLGFQPADILVMYAATQIYGTFLHTEYVGRLGFLEWFLVTPSHHRVHHASNPRYLDKNMGMCLIIWDRLFGTFQEEDPTDPPRFGLTKPLEKRDAVNIIFHEWKAILRDIKTKGRTLGEKARLVFGRPGWEPRRESAETS